MKLAAIDSLRPYRVYDRPVFILAAPRSGSTFLFDLMCQFQHVWASNTEMDAVWRQRLPICRSADPSDLVSADDYKPKLANGLRRDLYRWALWAREERGTRPNLRERLATIRVRYVDKTIANCFHLGFLKKAFPDARYIFLLRDGRATISSMMEGWWDGERFVNQECHQFIDPQKCGLSRWCYSAPPGWREQLARPLEEVCAWDWRQHVEAAEQGLQGLPAEQKLLLRYEDLMDDLDANARLVSEFCGLAWQPAVSRFIEKKPLSRTTVSAPDPNKWRQRHGNEIERILPAVAPVMRRLGYSVTL